MKAIALEKARGLMEKSATLLAKMEGASTFKELKSLWSDFLVASQRINTALEQGAKDNGQSSAWWGRQRHLRRTDPLLCYAQHARNVDEHGLTEIAETAAPSVGLGIGPGEWDIHLTTGGPGEPSHAKVTALGGQTEKSQFVKTWPARVKLVGVTDRGVNYEPPPGSDHETVSPIEAARGIYASLERLISEAAELPAED